MNASKNNRANIDVVVELVDIKIKEKPNQFFIEVYISYKFRKIRFLVACLN